MLLMSPLELIVIALVVLAILVIWLIWQNAHPHEIEAWPVTQGTIQSVGTVVVHRGRSSYSVEVADFSYSVSDEYYSGRLSIASSFPNGELSPRGLVNQRIQVHYNPRKPEKFSFAQTTVGEFILKSYNEPFGEDIDPINLNIDKL
jgi:hypothetical protein